MERSDWITEAIWKWHGQPIRHAPSGLTTLAHADDIAAQRHHVERLVIEYDIPMLYLCRAFDVVRAGVEPLHEACTSALTSRMASSPL